MARAEQCGEVPPGVPQSRCVLRPVGLALLIALVTAACTVRADDWPTFRHDVARSGVTSEQVSPAPEPNWSFQPTFGPQPGWGDPKPDPVEGILELRRFHFDDVFQPIIADGAVYFGSSADNKVYCLDLATGQVRWTVITGGPVRLSPTVAAGRVYVGSDDGWVWCLDAKNGSVVWRFHAAPEDRRVLGHGRMISLWPLRSSVLVDGGVAYVASGLFPAEGVFLYALDAATGKEIWRNDTCGEQPQSRISPQGYLLASATTLYAPMGRVSPAAFDRKTGELRYVTYFGKEVGGTYALLAGGHVYTGTEELVAYGEDSRDRFAIFPGRKLVVTEATTYLADGAELSALDRKKYPAASRRLNALQAQRSDAARELSTLRREQTTLQRSLKEADSLRKQAEAELAQAESEGPGGKAQAAALRTKLRKLQADRDALLPKSVELADQMSAANEKSGKLAQHLKAARAEADATMHWKTPCTCDEALILAGDLLLAGGAGRVEGVDVTSGEKVFEANVRGTAKGLAVAGGRLVVSTDQGVLYCFGPKDALRHGEVSVAVTKDPFADSPHAERLRQAAEKIVAETGIKRGYALVLGFETGQLALELARRTDLAIYCVDPDAAKVAAARKALDAAGVYGGRVCVEQWPLDHVPYSDYSANLVVSETALLGGPPPPAAEAARMLKPLGGTAMVGWPVRSAAAPEPSEWLKRAGLQGEQSEADAIAWIKALRGPLPGAGQWTHLYANPANTACSDDQRVECPLGVLWFGSPGPGRMVNRHQRATSPLAADGRMFVQGENTLMAYDAYNGLLLWQRDIPGAMRTNASHDGGNLALCRDGLLVAVGRECLRLDPATGKTMATYTIPPEAGASGRWGYLATVGDLVYGSCAAGAGQSSSLFALDLASGDTRWFYRTAKVIQHTTISIADGRLFLVDSDVSDAQRTEAVERQRERIATLPEAERDDAERALESADVRLVVALDATTGKSIWQKPMDLTHCGGGNIQTMAADGVLTIFGVYLDGHYWRQFFAGEFATRRVTALSAEEGELLWTRPVGYRVRPVIVGDTFHAEPWSFDLKTGAPKTRIHPITGAEDRWQFARPGHHCGCPAASPNCLFFRSYCLGYYDLLRDEGTQHFGAQRPGCWINFVPANGLLLFPEASAGCMCPFPNMCSVAFQPVKEEKAYSYYSAPGPMTPVKRLAINFGAAGDRADSAGKLWLAYPRPSGSLVLQFNVDVSFLPGGAFTQRNSTYTMVTGTDDSWLFTSAARGLRKCVVPLVGPADGTATYRVRLLMADLEGGESGQRVFDVKLQDKVVAAGVDVAAEAGGPGRALTREFDDVAVRDKLTIELVPKSPGTASDQMPILQAVEIVRQRVDSLGCAVPSFELGNLQPKASDQIELSNQRDGAFEGTLQVGVPKGFRIAPNEKPVRLASGGRMTIPIEASVAGEVAPGNYEARVRLVRPDGSLETERPIAIEHLGRRGRVVIPVAEDVYVGHRYPDQNKAAATVLLVDGGSEKMGDQDHNIALLKFKIEVPGRPVSGRLRIYNAGNPTGDSGRVRLITGPWSERTVTYATKPEFGPEVALLGRVSENQVVECPIDVKWLVGKELSLAIDPTTCDGTDYLSREAGKPAELIVEYEPAE